VPFVTDRGNDPCCTGCRITAVCLAIPGKILEIQEMGSLRAARVQFGGIVRQVSLNFVLELDWATM